MDTSSNVSFILPSEGEVGHGGWIGSDISQPVRGLSTDGCRVSFQS